MPTGPCSFFLEDRYSRLPSYELGSLLGEMNLLNYGYPAGPAIKAKWERAVSKACQAI